METVGQGRLFVNMPKLNHHHRNGVPMHIRKALFAAATASLMAVLSTTVVALTPSNAAAAAYNQACGGGYRVLDSRNISGATVFVTYNNSNGYNCVVTVRNSSGSAHRMGAAVRRSTDNLWVRDMGSYTTYAGPVYVHAPGQCIDWAGFNIVESNQAVVYEDFCN